ncbi:hypothetical protein M3M33_15740, partial [Loigolactobacillus coryniformis]|uniref:hypothetical protein n=1 Tax=Loigolactobacillus coryniformis TaxID=1610 RepID=UPI00201ADC9B
FSWAASTVKKVTDVFNQGVNAAANAGNRALNFGYNQVSGIPIVRNIAQAGRFIGQTGIKGVTEITRAVPNAYAQAAQTGLQWN